MRRLTPEVSLELSAEVEPFVWQSFLKILPGLATKKSFESPKLREKFLDDAMYN